MHTRLNTQKKTSSNSTSSPVTNQFQSRPFAPPTEASAQQQPDLQAQQEKPKGLGHSLANISITNRNGVGQLPIQTKLTIGQPGDKYEQEANQVAAKVVNQINSPVAQKSQAEAIQREEMSDEEDLRMKPMVQRQEALGGGTATADLEASINQARSGGQPLGEPIRRQMESAFGANFSGVKIHRDTQSDLLNRSIQARAFTTGNDIFFRQGAYNPGNRGGQELLAHELTHVVQQNSGTLQPKWENKTIQRSPVAANLIQRKNAGVDPGKITQAVEDLRQAMAGWGTDEDAIMDTLKDKTSAELAAIAQEYLKTYGRTLDYDLRDELSGKDLNQALGYLSKARVADQAKVTEVEGKNNTEKKNELVRSKEMMQAADALSKAMDGWGTDEDTIMQTLRGKTKEQIKAIKQIYLDHYGKTLEHDLNDELSGKDLKEALAYLGADQAYSAAKGLENSLAWYNDDEEKIEEILMSLKDAEIDRIKVNHGKIIANVLSSLGGFDKKVVEALLAKNKPKAIAYRLQEAMKGLGTDEKAVYKYLKDRTADELKAINKEYQIITGGQLQKDKSIKGGQTLEAEIADEFSDSSIFGAERALAESLIEADPYKQAAARIYNAAYGAGTDEEAIYNEFKGKSKKECDDIKKAYDKKYGGTGAFQRMIRDEFSDLGWGKELTKVKQYSEQGELDPVFALEDAMNGLGTSEAQIKEVLCAKTKQEIKNIKDRYKNETGKDLEKDLESELSGRDLHEVKLLLKGKPETIAEKWTLIQLRYEFEMGSGSSGFSRWVMTSAQDLGFTTSKLQLEKQYWRLTQIVDKNGKLKAGYTNKDFEQVYNYIETDVKNYEEAKNSVTEAIVTGINITTAIVATCLTAGAASPWLTTAISPWLTTAIVTGIGGSIGIAVKRGMQGDAYGTEEIGIDVLVTAVTAVLAGVEEAKGLGKKLDEIAKVFGDKFAGSVFKGVVTGAIKGGANDIIIEVLEISMKSDKLRDSLLDALAEMGIKGGIAGLKAALKKVGSGAGKIGGKEAWTYVKGKT